MKVFFISILVLITFFSFCHSLDHCKRTCVQPVFFWEENNQISRTRNDPTLSSWPTKCSLNEGGPTEFNTLFRDKSLWIDIMNSRSSNFCIEVAKEYISTFLNTCRTECVVEEISQILISLPLVLNEICTISGFGDHLSKTDLESETMKNFIEFMRNSKLTMSKFNRGELGIDRCIDRKDLDLNENQISDFCELSSDLKEICRKMKDRGELLKGSRKNIFGDCRLSKDIDDDHVCRVLISSESSQNRDCNGNGLIDSFEVKNKSELKCSSVFCSTPLRVGTFPQLCSSCYSLDLNNNSIPDECEGGREFHRNPIKDCNGDMLDDELSIKSGLVQDKDNNSIPDECQWGACCDNGFCHDSSFQVCNDNSKGTIFFEGSLCSEVKTCTPRDPLEDIGSCCVRMGIRDSFLKCLDRVSRMSCIDRGGSFSKFSCERTNCENAVGSCCTDYGGTCINSVSWKYCRGLSQSLIFDTRFCQEEECLCNVKNESIGSCIFSKICEDSLTFQTCTNLYGSFDFTRCENRIDLQLNERKKGSCCTQDSDCLDDIFSDHCESLNGKFKSGTTCIQENYCRNLDPDVDHECCYDPRSRVCEVKISQEMKCSESFSDDYVWILCDDKHECREVFQDHLKSNLSSSQLNGKCCKIGNECLKKIETEECIFFGGVVLSFDECSLFPECSNFFSPEIQKEKRKVNIIESGKTVTLTPVFIEPISSVNSSSKKVMLGDNEPSQIIVSSIVIIFLGLIFIPTLVIFIYYLSKSNYVRSVS